MAFSSDELRNYSIKAFLGIFGTGDRDSNPDNFAPYEELFAFQSILNPDNIWNSLSLIPSAANSTEAHNNAVANPTLIAEYGITNAIHCTPSPNNKVFFATSTYNDLSTTLSNWILPQLIPQSNGFASIGYTARFWNGNPNSGGTEIPTTLDKEGSVVGWFMHYGTGAVKVASTFSGIIDPTDIWITGFRYIGPTGLGTTSDNSRVLNEFSCESSATVGSVVYIDPLNNNKVLVNLNNTIDYPSIGIIEEKSSDTICSVLTHGKSNITFSSLDRGKKVFLSLLGSLTTEASSLISGYRQVLGFSYSENKIFVLPEMTRLKIS